MRRLGVRTTLDRAAGIENSAGIETLGSIRSEKIKNPTLRNNREEWGTCHGATRNKSDSDLYQPAIYVDLHARDVGRILRSQESHDARHFFGFVQKRFIEDSSQLFPVKIGRSLPATAPVLPRLALAIGPGATVFTRMPRPTSSAAAVLASERIRYLPLRNMRSPPQFPCCPPRWCSR